MGGDGGICGKVHLVAFSLERKEVMGILFNRRLQQPLEGDNGWAFSILVGRKGSKRSYLSGKGGQWDFSSFSAADISQTVNLVRMSFSNVE